MWGVGTRAGGRGRLVVPLGGGRIGVRRGRPGVDVNDPTGFSSPLGQIIVGLALLASLIVLLRWFWTNRRR